MSKTKELWSGFADMLQDNKELCRRLHQQAVAKGATLKAAGGGNDPETGQPYPVTGEEWKAAIDEGMRVHARYQKEKEA